MTMHDHAERRDDARAEGNFWTSRAFVVCAVLLLIVGCGLAVARGDRFLRPA
jgi:hypothetical protein